MSGAVWILVAVLSVWMLACGWCGYAKRFLLLPVVLIAGMLACMAWLQLALEVPPLDPNALTALMAAAMYGLSAAGLGWLAGRMVRQFRDSRVEDGDV